MSTLEDITNID